MTKDEFFARLDAAGDDIEELKKLRSCFVEGATHDLPFQPDIRLKGQNPDSAEEGQVAAAAANAWARAYRLAVFRKTLKRGYSGTVIVSEGDSWFQYPILLRDVIDNLMDSFAVMSHGAAGDTLANMQAQREYRNAIAETNASVFCFSASGNDVLGGGDLAALLHPFRPGMEVADVLRAEAVDRMLARIETGYEAVIGDALSVKPGLRVFIHGYDRPVPRKGGKWLGKPMGGLEIPAALQSAITGHLIDRLNARLARMEGRFPGRAFHVDCRGRIGVSVNSWYDELHPRNPGYARVAALFEAQINASDEVAAPLVVPPLPLDEHEAFTRTDMLLAAMDHPQEAIIGDRNPAPVGDGLGRHLTAQDREVLAEFLALERECSQPEMDKRLRARRHMVPNDDAAAFARILGESNLFPVNYLSRGARMAAAVAKVQLFNRGGIPVGSGSGFLVAPGLMLTNNHVIPTRDVARRARAVFNFQDDDQFQPMPTKSFGITDDVFFSSDRLALDFSFVSVSMVNQDGDDLSEFGQLTLIEESGKAVKGEPVSIIQHPRGDRKSIALRDSTIIGVKGDFIYYSTDTEPGSSGAPVVQTGPLRKGETAFIPALDRSDGTGDVIASDESYAPERWDGVEGYDPDFLDETFALPLPCGGAGVLEVDNRPDLPYTHFSIVMHADRKLAMIAACNTDGSVLKRLRRSGKWRLDPRIPRNAQTDNAAYRSNDYDRGHLVRRVAPMWGTEAEARTAMADTFHYTVCAPQHARLNQRIWLELEDYLLDWAERNSARLSIFTGPVFRADDPIYRGLVKIPADYWKIAVAATGDGLRAVGYLHTQKNLIPTVEEAFGDYKTHRVPVHVIGDLTGLNVAAFGEFDVAGGGFETDEAPRLVQGREDIGFV